MHDMLLAGSLDIALEEFLSLYERIRPTDRESHSDFNGLTGEITQLAPREILKAIQKRTSGSGQDIETHPRSKNLIGKKCIEALRDT